MNAFARLRGWRSDHLGLYVVGTVVVLGFLLLLLWRAVFVVIPPGHVGVLYDLLFGGTRVWRVYREGLRVKLPWNQMYVYDARLQNKHLSVQALSREGMVVDVDLAVLYRVEPSEAPLLHKEIGPDYGDRVVTPVGMGIVREYVTRHDSNELYTTESEHLQQEILAYARLHLAPRHVVVEHMFVLRVGLPRSIIDAAEQKLGYEQAAAAYVFRLDGERAEAERLRIKANGLRDYYSVVNGALTPSLLTWRGIEATIEIAQSPNAKLVIVGGGRDQMPLILGSELLKPPAEPGAARPAPPAASPSPERRGAPSVFPRGDVAPPPAAPTTPGAAGRTP
jgi:regulator of protease activity HflC (stomatin/prohibitin superfamily)